MSSRVPLGLEDLYEPDLSDFFFMLSCGGRSFHPSFVSLLTLSILNYSFKPISVNLLLSRRVFLSDSSLSDFKVYICVNLHLLLMVIFFISLM